MMHPEQSGYGVFFPSHIEESNTLGAIASNLCTQLQSLRENGIYVIYVSGKVSSDGDSKILKNKQKLDLLTQEMRQTYPDTFVFSAPDIISDEIYARLEECKLSRDEREDAFHKFWRTIISEVDHLIMTPGWQTSTGATDEHNCAKLLRKPVYYLPRTRRMAKKNSDDAELGKPDKPPDSFSFLSKTERPSALRIISHGPFETSWYDHHWEHSPQRTVGPSAG